MKQKTTILQKLLFSLLLFVGVFVAAPKVECQAAAAPTCAKTQTVYCSGFMDEQGKLANMLPLNPNSYIFIKTEV